MSFISYDEMMSAASSLHAGDVYTPISHDMDDSQSACSIGNSWEPQVQAPRFKAAAAAAAPAWRQRSRQKQNYTSDRSSISPIAIPRSGASPSQRSEREVEDACLHAAWVMFHRFARKGVMVTSPGDDAALEELIAGIRERQQERSDLDGGSCWSQSGVARSVSDDMLFALELY
eukprot:TRINITY_DN9_c0_g1_i3.p2 TRINITY_DN9_c0_g1~~TRINITY_DN9_c0_g1_i3.p2  ORF type:complete len:174 (-),score=47.10 TRINITY_DN9_c0_g1_i3:635-1156(-)